MDRWGGCGNTSPHCELRSGLRSEQSPASLACVRMDLGGPIQCDFPAVDRSGKCNRASAIGTIDLH